MKTTLSTLAWTVLVTAAAAQFNPAAFPPVNEVPPINSTEVKEWLKGLSFADVPVLPVHTGNPPACPALAQIPANQCWWTCQSCPADDIETCPTPGTWGLTFDDGPTPNTPALLQTLKANNVKATFFVMGSNVVRNAEVLKQEVAEGHHLASHTWSHHPLTTLSNEQIVAELKWTEKAVMDITGHRMKYMRPPYGDIDNRVRAVVKKLGYIVVDWTSDAYDSKDFALNAGFTEATLSAAVTTMSNTLKTYGANPGAKGIITLEHDLYPVTIEFAKRLIPVAVEAKLKVQSIAECLNDASPYQNGAGPIQPSPTIKPGSGNNGTQPTQKGPNGSNGSNGLVKAGSLVAIMAISTALLLTA
ncbi:chitin deacetylase [Dissophora globulifera]|uniref:Chitin deacetylase n=1 Tax=Dissophora globulifera TaxID=979702 RepID=A0A9P6RJ05_9FUNG|nr:chitin deacetylase [Dissophora globulifera]